MPTFYEWLQELRDDNSAFGDLARTAYLDSRRPQENTLAAWEVHMFESTKKSGVSGHYRRRRAPCLRLPEVRIPVTERIFPIFIEDLNSHLQQQVRALWCPLHLLLLDHALADHLIDRRLDETGADPFSIAIPFAVVDNVRRVVGDVRLQFPYILEHP